jgi:hypothetical protein
MLNFIFLLLLTPIRWVILYQFVYLFFQFFFYINLFIYFFNFFDIKYEMFNFTFLLFDVNNIFSSGIYNYFLMSMTYLTDMEDSHESFG